MNTLVSVCIVIITILLVSLLVMLLIALKDVRRVRLRTEKFLDTIEQQCNPIISEVRLITEDIRKITYTARSQVEKIDSATDNIQENIQGVVDKWINTIDLLHDAVVEPVGDLSAFLRGVSKGVRFFFNNGGDGKQY